MSALVDTNILVYRFDPRFPERQKKATELLRQGIADQSLKLAHQSIIEFVAATTRPLKGEESSEPLLSFQEACREAEDFLNQFEVYYPDAMLLRTALRGAATYQLSWFDAHLWAYAEYYGLKMIYSEDFEHRRFYGQVQVINPFF